MKPDGIPEFMRRFSNGLPAMELGAAALALPAPTDRSLTMVELAVIGKMEANPDYVEHIPPQNEGAPTQDVMWLDTADERLMDA
ncbi:MAG TPA: hypothetical protein VLF62_02945, partial [Candidatus Saccharimonadales bacterium]|nr:hypothetical protein [Candidatus Saccharimonadales bacterium]